MNTQRKAHVILVIIFGLFTVNGNAMEQSYPLSNKVGIFTVGCVVGACCVGAYYYHTMDKRLEQLEKWNKRLETSMDEMEKNRANQAVSIRLQSTRINESEQNIGKIQDDIAAVKDWTNFQEFHTCSSSSSSSSSSSGAEKDF